MESTRDPPKKEHWTVRSLAWLFRLLSPKKYHHLYTKEFFIGYGVSGQITAVQFLALDRLLVYLKPWWDNLAVVLSGWAGVIKETAIKLWELLLTAN